MRYLILLPLLAGCSTTSGGLAERGLLASYQSAKPARDVADCLSRTVTLGPILPQGEGFYTIRRNGYGVPMTRYDVKPGTTVEVRSNASFAAGLDKVAACL
jgi:hypothetical protein